MTNIPRLDGLLAYAVAHSPRLEAAFNRWKARLERIPQARALPDPRVSYQYFIENVETRVGPQRHRVGVSQTFPWFGKLDQQSGVAVEAARAAGSRYEAEKLSLLNDIQRGYYEYAYLTRAIQVVRENRDLLKYLEDVTRTRFKAAAAGHPDVIRVQVELGQLDDRLRSLEESRGPLVAGLNAMLNRRSDALLPRPEPLVEVSLGVDDDRLIEWLDRHNPGLAARRHELAGKREAVRLARKQSFPDVTVGVDYIEVGSAVSPGVAGSGDDALMAGVSVNVPIWRERYDAGVREALAGFGASVKTLTDLRNRLEVELRMAVYRFRDARRKIDLHRDTLVPKAREALKTTEAAFRAGASSFLDLIDSQAHAVGV